MVEEKEAEEVERTTTCLAVPAAGRMGRSPYQIHLALSAHTVCLPGDVLGHDGVETVEKISTR